MEKLKRFLTTDWWSAAVQNTTEILGRWKFSGGIDAHSVYVSDNSTYKKALSVNVANELSLGDDPNLLRLDIKKPLKQLQTADLISEYVVSAVGGAVAANYKIANGSILPDIPDSNGIQLDDDTKWAIIFYNFETCDREGPKGAISSDSNYIYLAIENDVWARLDMRGSDSSAGEQTGSVVDMAVDYQHRNLTGQKVTIDSLINTGLGRKVRLELTSANVILANGSTDKVSVSANSTTVTANNAVFASSHVGRTVEISGVRRTVATFVSSTEITLAAVLHPSIAYTDVDCRLIDEFDIDISSWAVTNAGYDFVDGIVNEVYIEVVGTVATTGSNRFRLFINPLS